MRCVCEAYVQRKWKHMWVVCETYVKHMRNTCDTINVFWDWIALCLCFTYIRLRIYVLSYVGGKIRPYFAQITQNKALFWNVREENISRDINKTQTRTQIHFVTFVFVYVYGYVLFMSGEK